MKARASITGLFLLLLGVGSALAASNVTMVARQFQNPGPRGDVVVALIVSPADGVTSVDLVYRYDPTVLSPSGVFRSGSTNTWSLNSSLMTPGFVELHLSGATPLAGNVEVAWVEFRIMATAESATPLTWVSAVLNGGAIQSLTKGTTVAVQAATVTMSMSDTAKAAPGQQVQIPISATSFTGGDAFDLSLSFNPAVLTPVSVQTTSLTSCMSAVSNLTIPGTVNIALYGVCTVSGAGPVVNVVFNVTGPIGSRTPLNVTRGAINEGTIGTVLDDGLFTSCESVDRDGDGYSSCAGDCNDANGAIKPGAAESCNGVDDNCDGLVDNVAMPQGSPPLVVGRQGLQNVVLSWAAVGGASAYDVVRGSLGLLESRGGDFAASTDQCLANDTTNRWATDAAVPAAGSGSWYLVRPVNCGGFGTYDEGSSSQTGFRDPGIAGSPSRCQ